MNPAPPLERRSRLGIPHALLILMVFFFFLPWTFRAARLSLGQKENDVKDWLPSDFPETAELEWFADHFAGESFVLATWPGCTSDDQRLKLFQQKLLHESQDYDASADFPLELAEAYARAKKVGGELELLHPGNDFLNWGGQQEKWLQSASGMWYYFTPDGRLYRWEEARNGPAAAIRAIRKRVGNYELKGQFVTAFGEAAGGRIANPFYNDTSMLCAPLFRTVQTGESIIAELTQEGGPLWPVDLTEEARREVVAKRRAMERLTGTLFAPAVPSQFAWTPEAFRQTIPEQRRDQLPEDFDATADSTLKQIVAEQFDGSIENLRSATIAQQTEVWYAVFDATKVEPPPRLTCVLVTLTDLAKDHLSFALGRGVLGQPRGRLLQLAEQSGVYAPPPPSLAPPPFNRQQPESVAGLPPLRMGGPPVDNTAIDEEGTVTLVRLVGYSIVIGIVLSYLCFGSLKITLMVFIVGGTAAGLSMAFVWWTSGRVDAVLMSMPSLVYVLGLSGAIHVINYYRDEVRARGEPGAARRALAHAFMPCTLASVTTAIGLISLFTSNLKPISNFGLYSAIGVIMTLGILFSFLPASLQIFVPAMAKSEPSANSRHVRRESRLSEYWAGVGRWITSHHGLVSAACLVLLLGSAIGLRNIKTSVQLLKLFDEEARIIHDYAWLETNFGKLVPMELIVRMPPSIQAGSAEKATSDDGDADTSVASVQSLDLLERVEAVSRIRKVVYQTLGQPGRDIVGQAMAADTFLPPLPGPSNSYSPIRAKYNRDLTEASVQLRNNDFLRLEQSGQYSDSELWRISLRVAALSDVDYGMFIATLREAVEPVLRAYDTRDELLRQLVSDNVDQPGKLKGKPRVMVVGSERPAPLEETNLLRNDGAIDARATYIATLGELLSGERIENPRWLDVSADKAKELVASEQWQKMVQSFDAVVWIGSETFEQDNFASARHLIDGEAIFAKTVRPTLLRNESVARRGSARTGAIPDVEGSGPIQVIYTGVVPVVYKAQRTLLNSLANSIGLAFVLIAAVMIWLLNPGNMPVNWLRPRHLGYGVAAGLVAMVPNVFPVLLVFGLMCHWGIEIDIGTMMTASVAMGVAVDDTIHFLAWFREHLDRGMHRVEAVIETYRRVAPAMTQTTIVGGLGLFVFALSTFTPTQRFGTLMLVMLAAALIGDLILLPALLAGPLGRLFKPRANADQRMAPTISTADEENASIETKEEPLPHLKVHFPERTDPPHRLKGK